MKVAILRNKEIGLRLSQREASLLRIVLEGVGGSPSGPRGEVDTMRKRLVALGITRLPDVIVTGGEGTIIEQCVAVRHNGKPIVLFPMRRNYPCIDDATAHLFERLGDVLVCWTCGGVVDDGTR